MDYFAPLSFDSTFGRVYHVFQKRWKDFLAISLLVYLSGLLFAILTALLMGNDLKIDGFSIQPQYSVDLSGDQSGGGSTTAGLEGWALAVYMMEAFIYYCFSCIAHGATVWLATHLYLEQYPSILDGLSNAGTKVAALAWSLVVIGVMTMVPSVIIVVALGQNAWILAIILICMIIAAFQTIFYHVYPVIMVENVGPLQALTRSIEISNGHRFFIFGILFAWGAFRSIIGLLIGLTAHSGYQQELTFNEDYMSYDVAVSYGWQYYVAQVLDTVLGILFLALESVFQAVLYLRNRAANESLDRVGLATALGSTEDGDYITMTSGSPSPKEENPKPLV